VPHLTLHPPLHPLTSINAYYSAAACCCEEAATNRRQPGRCSTPLVHPVHLKVVHEQGSPHNLVRRTPPWDTNALFLACRRNLAEPFPGQTAKAIVLVHERTG
jgi:hypothetical protein